LVDYSFSELVGIISAENAAIEGETETGDTEKDFSANYRLQTSSMLSLVHQAELMFFKVSSLSSLYPVPFDYVVDLRLG
jgi:hypothetical protein